MGYKFPRLGAILGFAVLLSSALQLAHAQPADAPAGDANVSPQDEIVTVAVQDYTMSGLVTRRAP